MKLGSTKIGIRNTLEDFILPAEHLHELEDDVASCRCLLLLDLHLYVLLISRTARGLIRKKDFCRIMHHASLNGFMIAQPLWGLVDELTLDENGLKRLQEEKELVLGTQGE
jgi:hypothetical protein